MTIEELRLSVPFEEESVLKLGEKTGIIENLFENNLKKHGLSLEAFLFRDRFDTVVLRGKIGSFGAYGFDGVKHCVTSEGIESTYLTTGGKKSQVNFDSADNQQFLLTIRR